MLDETQACFHLDIYFRLFITKNAENSAYQDDHVTAIIDFVFFGLVVVLCLGYGQLAPLSVPLSQGERGGSVVECRTPEREVRGSKSTAAVLCP